VGTRTASADAVQATIEEIRALLAWVTAELLGQPPSTLPATASRAAGSSPRGTRSKRRAGAPVTEARFTP